MPLNKTLHRFSFSSVGWGTKWLFSIWSVQIRHQPLLNHLCKITALQARTKRKWIFCILFHVIFVAFKSNINYSCDMRNGFSVLSGDTAFESAVGRIQRGPLVHSCCCYCDLVKLYSVFKETESIYFHLIWSCPLFHVTFCTDNMFCQTEETCSN